MSTWGKVVALLTVIAGVGAGLTIPVSAKGSVESAWCSLKLGQPSATAITKLGKPHGHLAKVDIAAVIRDNTSASVQEWDLKSDKLGKEPVLLVESVGGKILSLQAYANYRKAANSADPAHGLSCKAFREPVIPTPPPTPAGPIFSLSGQGIETTAQFSAPTDWNLNWTYDCSAFGGSGNFIVTVFQGANEDFSDAGGPNELGPSGSGTDHFYSGGRLNLQVNSECSWAISVVKP